MVGLTRLAASLAICLPLAAHGATLEVSEGRLLGAHDVMVGDALWDVVFNDGPWDFSAGTDLPATNRTDADAFSQALLGQVLLDSELGNFNSDPEATNGCENLNSCQIYTPYLVDATNTTFSVLFNQRAGGTQDDFISEGVLGLTGDFSDSTTRVLALWSPATPVLANDDFIVDFGGIGLWARMNDTNWLKLANDSPTEVVTGDIDDNGEDDVIAVFASGIFIKRNLGGWAQLHNTIPNAMTVGDLDNNGQDDVVIDFGDIIGLYAWMNDTNWLKLANDSPTQIVAGDIDGTGKDDVIAVFGSGIFINYDLEGWIQLHNSIPDAMAVGDLDNNGNDDLVVDFDAVIGLYAWRNGTEWLKLYNGSPDLITTGDIDGNGADDVVATFGSSIGGTWNMLNLGGWSELSAFAADEIVTSDVDSSGQDDLIASFRSTLGGIFVKRNQVAWSQLHNFNPDSIAVGNLDGTVGVLPVEFQYSLYDDFSDPGGAIDFSLWGTDGNASALSTVEIVNGALIATAVKDSDQRVDQGLWVTNATNITMADFQAFRADFEILEATGNATNRAQILLGIALEQTDYFVDTGINFYSSGEIEYFIEIFNRLGLPSTEIAFGTITTVDPGTSHILSIGWDGSNYIFQVDNIAPVVIPMSTETNITQSSNWSWAAVRATVRDSGTGTTSARIDNVEMGSL